jgi:CRP-like cAMP-binding protein
MFYKLLKDSVEISHKKTVKRGEIIYHEGDPPEGLYFVEEGLVGLFHVAENGKETFLRVFSKDCIFGHRSYFAETPYHASSVALTKTELVIISKEECHKICESRPDLLKELIKMLAKDLGAAELRMAGLQDKTANARIAESLVYLKLKHPHQVWTRKEVAEYSGSTFETVTRVMTSLSEKGLIKKEGRDFTIFDPEKLLSFSSLEY